MALQDFGFGSLGLATQDFTPDAVIQLGQPPRRFDLMTTIDGVDFETCYARRETVELTGLRLDIIGLEDFKTNKRATGRLKDLADLEELEPRGSSAHTGPHLLNPRPPAKQLDATASRRASRRPSPPLGNCPPA